MQEAAQQLVQPHELLPFLESAMRLMMGRGDPFVEEHVEKEDVEFRTLETFSVSHKFWIFYLSLEFLQLYSI